MPPYGTPQSGSNMTNPGLNITSVVPGERITLFDGTETAAQALSSIAFSRGNSPSMSDNGVTFYAKGMPAASAISVQGSNTDLDGDYFTLYVMNPDTNGNAAYTDIGRPEFYRVNLSTYSTGAMPVVTAQR